MTAAEFHQRREAIARLWLHVECATGDTREQLEAAALALQAQLAHAAGALARESMIELKHESLN